MKKTTGLGRGLGALIDTTNVAPLGGSSIDEIALENIVANPHQPRTNFDEESLQDLADSIRENGVISPVTLRKETDTEYTIITGERRVRAARMAGLKTIPAYIRQAADDQMAEWALVENIQREDLDAIEIALSYQNLLDKFDLTQERISEKVGKKRATIANYLRLLRLPAEIQMGIRDHKIEMGHARALLAFESVEEQLKVYKRILNENLSVRAVEELSVLTPTNIVKPKKKVTKGADYSTQEKALQEKFGLPVKINNNKVVISFHSKEELQRLIEH